MRQKMQEITGGAPAAPTTPSAPTAATAAEPAPVFPPGADEQAIAKARDAMRQQMHAQASENGKTRQTRVTGFSTRLDFPPLDAPPLPISAEKQQKLEYLLKKYKADEIGPEEYQAERAKILAGQ